MCEVDADCPAGMLCYPSTISWVKSNSTEGECFCSTWYGWAGDECSEDDVQNAFGIVLAFVFMYLNTIGILVAYRSVYLIVEENWANNRGFRQLFVNSFNVATVLTAIALTSFYLNHIITVIQFFGNPMDFDNIIESSYGPYKSFSDGVVAIERLSTIINNFCAVLAGFSLGLSWVELSEKSKNLRQWSSKRSMGCYKMVNICFMFLFTVLDITLLAMNEVQLAIFAALPFLVFVAATFAIGGIKMRNLLKSLAQSPNNKMQASPTSASDAEYYTLLMRLIEKTAMRIVAAVIVIVIGGLAYASVGDWREISPPGQISRAYVMLSLFYAGVLFSELAIVYYSFKLIEYRRKRQEQMSSASVTDAEKGSAYHDDTSNQWQWSHTATGQGSREKETNSSVSDISPNSAILPTPLGSGRKGSFVQIQRRESESSL